LQGKFYVFFKFLQKKPQHSCGSNCSKSLAEFAAEAANKIKIVFGRGVYVDENTSQAASVEFVRLWRTNYARSRLQNTGGKAQRAFPPYAAAA